MELYAKNGVELTRKQAESEIIADAIPVILTDKQTVQELVRTDRTLAERIRDFFEDFFDELTQIVAQLAFGDANKAEVAALMADQETVREIADLFTAALESTNNSGFFSETAKNGEYITNYDGNQTESGQSEEENGDIRHSIAQIVAGDGSDYGIGVVLDSNMLTGLSKYERREMVKLRVLDELAGKTVIAYDGENNPVEISFAQKNEKFLNSAGKKRRVLDEISRKSIDKEIKQEAVVVADELISASKSGSSSPSYHSHGWLDDWGKNNWDTRTVYIQEKNKTVWEATLHIANPADGRKILYDIDPIKMVAGSVKTVPTTTNTNITDVGTKSNTSDENSEENFYNDLVNSGDQPRLSVKSSGRDSEGNTLSEGQAEYFKDSKMRDDDGNLLVVYHGSPAYDEITTFKRGKKGWLGSGIYVTSRKSDAQRYADKMGPGGRIYSLYANVTNPLVVTEQNPVPVILKAAYGRDSVYRNRSAKQANDPDIITRSDIQKLAGAGYDGIIWKYGGSVEASVFDPEQVKRTDNTKPTSNPDTRFSMKSTARDSSYQQAVESGDMETAQELVNEAAAEAGYTIKAYHGTHADRFNVFDKERVGKGTDQFGAGFYFATDKEAAAHYGSTMYSVFLGIKNPVRIQRSMDGGDLYDVEITPTQAYKILKKHPLMYDAEESPLGDFFDSYWEEGPKDWMIREMAKQYTSIGLLDGDRTAFRDYPNELHEAIREVLGYDGVEVTFDNTDEKFYVAWFDTQMKSADPVTYDDNGNVIPLSERFNREENDIRYSMKSTGESNLFDSMMGNDQKTEERLAVSEKELARVKAENERLSERIDALKEQFKVTKGYRPNEKALRRVAQGVLKRASSQYDADTLTEDLRGLFDSIGKQDGFDSDSIMATANAIARKVLEKSSERDDTVYEATKDARDYFRRARLSLTDKQKAETASAYDSYNAYRRSLMGKLNLANDGLPLDQAWGEISEMFPGYFDKNTPEGDQPAKVKEFLETAYARPYRNPYGTLYDMDDAAYELASELFRERNRMALRYYA